MRNVFILFLSWIVWAADASAQYDLRNIEFLSNLTASQSGIDERSNDIWGWTDPQTEREYALLGRLSRTVFVDVTDPRNPEYLGFLPSTTGSSTWRDIKVYADHAYVVSDQNGPHGVQIFDLTRLRGVTAPTEFSPDNVYNQTRSAHNIAINEETGYAYVTDGQILDLRADPKHPVHAGFVSPGTHDSLAVIYRGDDTNYQGREIFFSFTGTVVSVFDVSDKDATSRISFLEAGRYEHQGWLSEDHNFLFVNA
ncbi:MAG: choice-of-anchor B family protein, partial [Planctomycetota bacterium]